MPAPDAAQYMLQQAQQPAISQHAIYPISHAGGPARAFLSCACMQRPHAAKLKKM
jgi:hypothetical protein